MSGTTHYGIGSNTYRDGVTDPINKGCSLRIIRGGSGAESAPKCRSAGRVCMQGYAGGVMGFRPLLTARPDVK